MNKEMYMGYGNAFYKSGQSANKIISISTTKQPKNLGPYIKQISQQTNNIQINRA